MRLIENFNSISTYKEGKFCKEL